jgi:hypothetical protein
MSVPSYHSLRPGPLIAAGLICTACVSTGRSGFPVNQNAIFVHPDGRVLESLPAETVRETRRPAGRRLNDEEGAAQLGALMQAVRESPHDTIIVLVHGGRVSLGKAYRGTEARAPAMLAAGYHPIFVNWNSSASSTLFSHLFRVRQGQDWGVVAGALSSPFVVLAGAGRAVSRAPLNVLHLALDHCAVLGGIRRGTLESAERGSRVCRIPGVDDFRRHQADFEARLDDTTAATTAVDDSLALGIGTYDLGTGRRWLRLGSAVVTAVPQLVTGPLIDGFGSGAFYEMRRRARSMIRSRGEYAPTAGTATEYLPPSGAVYALMDSLRALVLAGTHDSVPPERRRRRSLILAGHSMGTIVLDRVLLHFPDLPVQRIYYLAAASTMHEIEGSVVPFLERNPGTLYYHGMLHPYADAGEWQPDFLDMVPRGSLLEWVDDYLTTPETPFDRVSGKWSNIVAARQIFTPAVRSRVVLKSFGVRDEFDARDPVLFRDLERHDGLSLPGFRFWDDASWQLRPWRTKDGKVVRPGPPGQHSQRAQGAAEGPPPERR